MDRSQETPDIRVLTQDISNLRISTPKKDQGVSMGRASPTGTPEPRAPRLSDREEREAMLCRAPARIFRDTYRCEGPAVPRDESRLPVPFPARPTRLK